MVTKFRPMLAAKADVESLAKLTFPLLASVKLDGVRAIVKDGVVYSRSMTPFPNKALQAKLGRPELNGYDGELIVGNPWDKNVCDATRAETASINAPCSADFYVFDRHDLDMPYVQRMARIYPHVDVHVLEQRYVNSLAEVQGFESNTLEQGYEGIILRAPNAPYKQNRSTLREQFLIKLKRFEDSEAVIIGMEELMHNANEAQESNIGLTKRQTLQENLVGMNTMGALLVRDIHTGVEFKIGTGFTQAQRDQFWRFGEGVKGELVKYKYFPVGVKDKPRHPVYLGFRDRRDM